MRLYLPVIGAALVVAVVVVAWLLWPQKEQPGAGVGSAKPAQEGARLVIEGGPVESTQMAATSGELSSSLPEHITLSMIREIRENNGQKVLVFSDGSELELTPYMITQLTPEVRLRVEYKRGRP